MIRRPPRSTLSSSSAASDVYKRQPRRRVRCRPGRAGEQRLDDRTEPRASPGQPELLADTRSTRAAVRPRFEELRQAFGELLWDPFVPTRAVLAEALGAGAPIHEYGSRAR